MRTAITAASLFAAIIGHSPTLAQDAEQKPSHSHNDESRLDQRAEDIATILRGEIAAEKVSAPEFLATVPTEQLAALAQRILPLRQ